MLTINQVEETGGPEQNVMRDVPVPTPKDGEVLLKVEWTGANFIDNCELGSERSVLEAGVSYLPSPSSPPTPWPLGPLPHVAR